MLFGSRDLFSFNSFDWVSLNLLVINSKYRVLFVMKKSSHNCFICSFSFKLDGGIWTFNFMYVGGSSSFNLVSVAFIVLLMIL